MPTSALPALARSVELDLVPGEAPAGLFSLPIFPFVLPLGDGAVELPAAAVAGSPDGAGARVASGLRGRGRETCVASNTASFADALGAAMY